MELSIKEKGLIQLTIPIFLEMLLMNIVGNIDIFMVSKFSDKGVGVLGGIGQVLSTQNIIFSFISIGTGILVSQYLGGNKSREIKEVITISFILNLILALILGLFYLGFAEEILLKIKLKEELIHLGINYFRIVGGFGLFTALSSVAGNALRSYGYTKEPLVVNILINCINILGNGIFLFGWLGGPILGITGVAISTAFARLVGMVLIIYLLKKRSGYKFSLEYLKPFPMDILKNIGKIGIPSGMEHFAWNGAQIIIVSMVNTMGTATITAKTYLELIASFMMMISISLGHGTAILTGRYIGGKEIDKAYKRLLSSLKYSFFGVLILAILVNIFKNPIMSFFTKDPEILAIMSKVFIFYIFIETGRTFNIVIINSLHAAGDVKFPLFAGIACMFTIAAGLTYILGIKLGLGLVGVWIANGSDEWIRGLIMLKRWTGKRWTTKGFVK